MFKIIVETLGGFGHSPEREGQQETQDGIIYEDSAPFIWHCDGCKWRCRPEGGKALVEVFYKGVWIKNSTIEHTDQAVEFAIELAADWLDQILLSMEENFEF